MGIVNDYINKIVNKINKSKTNEDKPWLKYYDRMPEHLEYYNGSMYDAVSDIAIKYPFFPALEYFEKVYNYEELIKNVDNVAVALKELNVVENECVTICMPNIPEAIFIVYAVNKIGAICNIIHPLSKEQDIKNAMEEVNSSIIFITDVSYEQVKNLNAKIVACNVSNSMNGLLKFFYNTKNKKNMRYRDDVIDWKEFTKLGEKIVNTHANRSQNDPAVIIYSGGTTGKTKGIILSNLCFNSISKQCEYVCKEAKPGYSIFSALPIFHGFGLCVCIHVPLSIGLKCILIPKIDMSKINKTIMKKKPNLLPVIPTMLNVITKSKSLGPKSFESVKVILSGGDYLSSELRTKTEEYFRNCGSIAKIQVGYGLSEATAFISATCESVKDRDNIGIANPDNIIKIFEPYTDIEKGYDEVGEICVKGPSVMLGYVNQDKETESVLRKHYDGDIWLHTGDLGYLRSDGVLHYSSRLKRMIISNGYNIYPLELEEIICKCEYVESCIVVGIKHKIKQEVAKAVIVLKEEYELTNKIKDEIKKYCEKNIVKYAIPYEYEFRKSLPITKIGKVNYRELQKDKDSDNSNKKNDKKRK
jgi:long-chain acyl-CoA synthetase